LEECLWNHSLEWTWLLASGGRKSAEDARRGVGRESGDEGESESEDDDEGYVMGVGL
jgi:hypothetical protein